MSGAADAALLSAVAAADLALREVIRQAVAARMAGDLLAFDLLQAAAKEAAVEWQAAARLLADAQAEGVL